MFRLTCFVIFLLSVILHVELVVADEIQRVNERSEVVVNVPSGGERKIIFEEPVALGVPTSFKSSYRVQSLGNSVFIRALKSVDRPFRLFAKGQTTQRTYILTVTNSSANLPDFINEPIAVVWMESNQLEESISLKNKMRKGAEVSPVELVRFVSQSLFAPKYAIEPLLGVRQVALNLPDSMDFIYSGSPLKIKPLLAYRAGSWTVTAFEAVNKSSYKPLDIDVMQIYGRVNAYSAVSQHQYVGVTDTDNKTVIYVVTQGDLVNSLNVGV